MKHLRTPKHATHLILLAVVLIAAVALRLNQLGRIPVSMSDDEIRETMSAVSLWQTGRDLTGNIPFPFSFFLDGYTFTPIPIYISAPFVGILGPNMFTARLPYALAGILTVAVIYALCLGLTKNRSLAVLSAMVLGISVWHLQISRFAVETGFALLFYCLGAYFFLGIEGKNRVRSVTVSMFMFFLAFHSYNAMKILYVPVLLILIAYEWKYIGKNTRIVAVIAAFVLLTIATFLYSARTQNALQHGGTLFLFQDNEKAAAAVGAMRQDSRTPALWKTAYFNKFTYWSDVFLRQYLFAFSPQHLLTDQESNGIYAVYGRGQLYLIEGPLILLGLLYLARRSRRQLTLILAMLAIAPLPSGLSAGAASYGMRSSFMLPWLSILSAAGLVSIPSLVRSQAAKKLAYAVIAVLYIYLVTGYLGHYYFDWVRRGSKFYAKGTRDMVELIRSGRNSYSRIIVAGDKNTVRHYAFYERIPAIDIQGSENGEPLTRGNIIFRQECLTPTGSDPRTLIPENSMYISAPSCHPDTEPDRMIESVDGDDEWFVYERE